MSAQLNFTGHAPEKEQAAPTWKKTYGHHPLTVFADHGPDGSGEPLAIVSMVATSLRS